MTTLEKKPSLATKLNDTALRAGVALTVAGLAVSTAHAEGGVLDTTAITEGMTEAAATNKLIFAGALLVLAGFVAWRYLKRGANSA